jgi:hypothetical protein
MIKNLLGLLSLFLSLDLFGLGLSSLGGSFRLDLGGGGVLSLGRSGSVGSRRVGRWGVGNVADN